MTIHIWIANAEDVEQVVTATPGNVSVGDTFSLTINGKSISYTAVAATVADVTAGLVAAWNATTIPEFSEVTATDSTTHVTLTGTPGVPFTVTGTASEDGGTNEVKRIVLGNSPTGGTWDYSDPTYGDATNIAYNADAATLETALEAVYGAGNIAVTGSAGDWTLTFQSGRAAENIPDITVDGANLTGGNATVAIAVTQAGVAAVNEVQEVALLGSPTGGNFKLIFLGQITGDIAFDANAAAVLAALNALPNIQPGDVVVGGGDLPGTPVTLTFGGQYLGQNVAMVGIDTSGLTGGSISGVVATTVPGVTGTNESIVLHYALSPTGSTNFSGGEPLGSANLFFGFGGQTTAAIPDTATAATIQAALEGLSTIGDDNVAVSGGPLSTGGVSPLYGSALTIEFKNDLAATPLGALTVTQQYTSNPPPPQTYTTYQAITEGVVGTNEQQTVTVSGASAGTIRLGYGGETVSVDYDATAAEVKTALETLSGIPDGSLTATGGPLNTGAVTIEFSAKGLQSLNVAQLTIDASGLQATITETTPGVAGVNEIVTLTVPASVFGGTTTLTHDSNTTAAIAWNATGAAVKAALELLSSIDEVTCSGSWPGTITVEFTGAEGQANQPDITATEDFDNGTVTASTTTEGEPADTLTVATTTAATGKNFWNNAKNWSGGAVPVNSDTAVFDGRTQESCLYGLAQSAVTLALLDIRQQYGGQIGLPEQNANGYEEYRPTYLAIGATDVLVGRGDGGGSGLIKIDNGSVQTTWNITNTGRGDNGVPAILWKGSHASNVFNISKGELGVAFYADETATIATLRMAFVDNPINDAVVICGAGATLTNIFKDGGTLELNSATTSLTQLQGTTTIYAGAHTFLDIQGGDVFYLGTGTLTDATLSGDGHLDFSGDLRAKTVTNVINVFGDEARVSDPFKVVSNLRLDLERRSTLEGLSLGGNVLLTRGSVT